MQLLKLSSHNLAVTMAKWYKIFDDQKICRYYLKNDVENEMQVLFDCDNYNALRQDSLKKIEAISYKNLKFSYSMDL